MINVPVQPSTANNSVEKTEKVKKPKKSKKKKKEKKHKKKSKKKRKYSSSSSSSSSEVRLLFFFYEWLLIAWLFLIIPNYILRTIISIALHFLIHTKYKKVIWSKSDSLFVTCAAFYSPKTWSNFNKIWYAGIFWPYLMIICFYLERCLTKEVLDRRSLQGVKKLFKNTDCSKN